MWSDKCWPWDGGCLCDLANYSCVFIVWHTAIHWFPKATLVFAVQLLSWVQLFAIPWPVGCQASLSLTISWSFPKFMSIESVRPPNCLKLCHSLLFLPSISPNIRDFSNESALHIRWPKYWSSSFIISLSNEYSKLISFKIYGFDLFAFQVTLKSLL